MADIPGIIEGASEGKRLGLRCLRHIERNATLLFLIPADTEDIQREYDILLNEITQYNPELAEKQRILAITKCDMLDQELMEEMKQLLPKDIPSVFISSISGIGINQLKDLIWSELHKDGYKKEIEISHKPIEVQQIEYEEKDDIEEETFDTIYMNEEDEEWDLEKYKGIGWDQ